MRYVLNNIHNDESIEKYVYNFIIRMIMPLCTFGLVVFFLVICIEGIESIEENLNGEAFFLFIGAGFFALLLILSIKILINTRLFSSKIFLSSKGLCFKSKVREFQINWKYIKKIYIKKRGNWYFIHFDSGKEGEKGKRNKHKDISGDIIIVHLDFEILEFIEQYWNGTISYGREVERWYERYKKRKYKANI